MGYSEGTKKSSKCGFDSITSLLPLSYKLNPKKWKCFDILREALESSGYKTGLTLQALPYDWRLSINDNQVAAKFETILTRLKEITGKKSAVVAHSFGNVNTLNNIWKMPLAKRQALIQRFFAIAPPFLGSPTVVSGLLGGSSEYYYSGMGLNFDTFKNTLGFFPGAYDLMPRNTWKLYENTDWMKQVINRLKFETGMGPDASSKNDFLNKLFPKNSEDCYSNDWTNRKTSCLTGLSEFYEFGTINGEKMTTDNIEYILGKYSYNVHAAEMYKKSKTRQFDEMPNPGVEVVIIYTNFLMSPSKFTYRQNPRHQSIHEGADFI